MSSLQAELKEKLYKQPEVLELHQKFCDTFDGLLVEESENLFVEGFRFGFLMALDVFEIQFTKGLVTKTRILLLQVL